MRFINSFHFEGQSRSLLDDFDQNSRLRFCQPRLEKLLSSTCSTFSQQRPTENRANPDTSAEQILTNGSQTRGVKLLSGVGPDFSELRREQPDFLSHICSSDYLCAITSRQICLTAIKYLNHFLAELFFSQKDKNNWSTVCHKAPLRHLIVSKRHYHFNCSAWNAPVIARNSTEERKKKWEIDREREKERERESLSWWWQPTSNSAK